MTSLVTPVENDVIPESVAINPRRRPGFTLYRYLISEMTFPTVYALLGFTFVVLTRDLLGFSDLVINRGLGTGAVALMAFYNAVPLAAQMLPFAMLVGCLVALGRLGADREILVLEASGVSGPRLIWPLMAFAVCTWVLALALSLAAAPAAERALDSALREAAKQNPAAKIQSGRVHWYGAWKMEALEVSARGDRMEGVLLRMPDIGETVFSKRGSLEPDEAGGTRVTLEDGAVLLNPRKKPRELRFESMTTRLPETETMVARSEVEQLRGYSLDQLGEALLHSSAIEVPRESLIEWHRRFALPTATLVFGFLALPLFFSRQHFSRSSGGVIGILTVVVYYGLLQLGDGLEQAGRIGVPLALWLPNLVMGAVGVALVFRLNRSTTFARGSESVRPVQKERPPKKQSEGVRPKQWALQRYVALRFLELAAGCFLVVLVAYLVVDILERLQLFAGYGATGWEVLRYYGARVPILASRVVPMALLVATALTVSLLAVQGELMGMRSCGIPAPRALLPILIICALIVPAYFVLNNEVLPRANAMASYVKRVEIKNRDAASSGKGPIWYRTGTRVYEAERLDPQGGTARNITVYELGEGGLPVSRADATSARHIGNGVWRLVDPVRVERSERGLVEVDAPAFAELGEEIPAEVDTRQLSVGELRGEIEEVEASGYPATAYRVDLYRKLAAPLACLILPALALFFAVAGPPHPSSALTLVVSAVVAVSYVLMTGIGTSLGYGGALPPIVAGWGPSAIFALIGGYLGLRLRGLGQSF